MFPIIVVAVCIIAVLMLGFTLARVGVINIPGISPTVEIIPETIEVGYIADSAPAGTEIKSVIQYKTINLPTMEDEEINAIVPDDAISPGDNLDGYVTKIDLAANTPVTYSMICPVDTDEKLNDTARYVEVSYVTLSDNLAEGDYIDIRLKKYYSQKEYDYSDDIVVTKKQIVSTDGKKIVIKLNEDELMLMTAANVDMIYTNQKNKDKDSEEKDKKPNSYMYATKFVSVAQKAATVTYTNDELVALMKSNPNLINNPTELLKHMIGQ
jgi:hypothetical protein